MSAQQPSSEALLQILARIDREIETLLKKGKLSPLNYDLTFDKSAKTIRRENLKALLAARRCYRQMKMGVDETTSSPSP